MPIPFDKKELVYVERILKLRQELKDDGFDVRDLDRMLKNFLSESYDINIVVYDEDHMHNILS